MTSPFPLPLAFTSWAFNKTDGQPVDNNAVDNMTKAARLMGAKSIAVQIGEGITEQEIVRLQELNGLFVVGWCECNTDTAYAVQQLGLDGFMPQIEGAGQYDAAVRTLRTLTGLLPVAVVSDYGGLDTKERCDVLRSYGARTLFVEAYADAGAQHADLPHYVTASPSRWFTRRLPTTPSPSWAHSATNTPRATAASTTTPAPRSRSTCSSR